MQDRYAGDIGDFGKFVLLRQLSVIAGARFTLGINWYRVHGVSEGTNDGRHVHYLYPTNRNASQFENCDPFLYPALRKIVNSGQRSVQSLEQSCLLPSTTQHYSEPVPSNESDLFLSAMGRVDWFEKSIERLRSADAIFLDPDNGIQPPSATKAQSRSIKYAFVEEIKQYYDMGKLVIVYNHRDRTPMDVYKMKFLDLQASLGQTAQIRVLRFRRVSVRDYVFLYTKAHSAITDRLFNGLIKYPFHFLFEELPIRIT